MHDPQPDDLAEAPSLTALARQLAASLVVIGVAAYLVSRFLRGPIERAGAAFVDEFGLLGVFAGVLALDTLPGTIHEPLMALAWEGGLAYLPIVLASGTGSVAAGVFGWVIGRWLGRFAWVQRTMHRYHIGPFMRRYGGWAVAIAAITPFPYAITTYGAGAAGVRLPVLLAGSMLRFPKEALYFGIYVYGATLAQ